MKTENSPVAADQRQHTPAADPCRTFAEQLKRYRQRAGLTQPALAHQAGLGRVTPGRLERRESLPRPATARKLARVLSLSSAESRAFLAVAAACYATDKPPPVAPARPLPMPATPFVGRDAELRRILDWLATPSVRLVTITGPPGIGKTRLALEVARTVSADYAGGVVPVNLVALRDPAAVLPAIARELGVRASRHRALSAQIVAWLMRQPPVLLLLDNCDPVVAAAPELADLLAICPTLTILATSRQRLGLRGERILLVPPLALPPAAHPPTPATASGYEAIALFVALAQLVDPDLTLTEEQVTAIAAICRQLEGIPLALELAAARLRLLSPAALLAQLAARLPLLTGGPRDLPAHQQTMRRAIAWSSELLDPAAHMLWCRLSVFAGGADLDAVTAVCTEAEEDERSVLDRLSALVDASLVQRVESEPVPRVAMLETLREFAGEQLAARGMAEAMAERHSAYYTDLAETAGDAVGGPATDEALETITREHANLAAAFDWCVRQRPRRAARLVVGLEDYWLTRGALDEGRRWAAKVLAREDTLSTEAQAAVRNTAGSLAHALGELAAAAAYQQEAFARFRVLGDDFGLATTHVRLGLVAHDQARFAAAVDHFHAAYRIFTRLDDTPRAITCLLDLAMVAHSLGDRATARELYQLAEHGQRASGDQLGLAMTLNNLGLLELNMGDLNRGRELLEEARQLWQAAGDEGHLIFALANLGLVAELAGDDRNAAHFSQHALAHATRRADRPGISVAFVQLASLAAAHQQFARAVRLLGAAEALRETIGSEMPPDQQPQYRQVVDAVHDHLGAESFAAAWAAGRDLPLAAAVAEAQTLTPKRLAVMAAPPRTEPQPAAIAPR